MRAGIPPDARARQASRLARGILQHPLLPRTPGTALVPVPIRDEIDTEPITRLLLSLGWDIARPRLDLARGRIDAVITREGAVLQPGAFGIPEPPPAEPAMDPSGLALVLVPGLAFDARGGRLGMGGGHFDRFLAPLAGRPDGPVILGVGFAEQLVAHIPLERHDVAMHGLQLSDRSMVTPRGRFR